MLKFGSKGAVTKIESTGVVGVREAGLDIFKEVVGPESHIMDVQPPNLQQLQPPRSQGSVFHLVFHLVAMKKKNASQTTKWVPARRGTSGGPGSE